MEAADTGSGIALLVTALHAALATAVIAFAILLGLLGTYQFMRHKAVGGGFRSGYLVLSGLAVVQSAAGLAQLLTRGGLHDRLHVVYGIFAVVFLPGVYFYVNRGDRVREAAFLAIACWVVLVAFLRARATSG